MSQEMTWDQIIAYQGPLSDLKEFLTEHQMAWFVIATNIDGITASLLLSDFDVVKSAEIKTSLHLAKKLDETFDYDVKIKMTATMFMMGSR